MNRSKTRGWWLGAVLLWVSMGSGTAMAQADAVPTTSDGGPMLACGVAEIDAGAAEGYFSDLCTAFALALGLPGGRASSAPADRIVAWLERGEVDIAIGLPWEATGDAPIRHGPVVLITSEGRFGLAARDGTDALLETVSWLFHALVEAEALGIGRDAVASDLEGLPDATVRAYRTYERRLAEQLGLDRGAVRRMLHWGGHHGELYASWFDASVDANRPVELGGQLYAPPVGGE